MPAEGTVGALTCYLLAKNRVKNKPAKKKSSVMAERLAPQNAPQLTRVYSPAAGPTISVVSVTVTLLQG
jgi:hypothetical protein